ncbi:hypothetical protein [Aquitalea aquatica]|uniref:DUF4123 domain-containing protein n=1 Tax=Aquitalea aquatica TaxID=3044273 RepID=A0A838Y2J6_9NEIS|nr:hypothetical protein [Aquitalea magnusonii]MBA4706849.1 hypothetical protein [Aquitalea magnusonii]
MNQDHWQPLTGAFMTQGPHGRFSFAIASAEQRAELPDDWPWLLLTPKGFEDNEGLMPSLLHLSALTPEDQQTLFTQLETAQQENEQAPLSTLLSATTSPATMARHLCHAQVLVHQRQKFWLRIFDGRVWSQLPRVLNTQAILGLYGPVSQWASNLYGSWALMPPPSLTATKHTTPDMDWEALLRIGAVNRALAQTACLNWQDAIKRAACVDSLVQRAQQLYQLGRLEDQVSFACYGIRYGSQFDSHPIVQREIANLMAQSPEERTDSTLVDCLALLTEEQWATIQASSIE